jgi:ATP-dependent Clp protease ATP-binding subunit ClpB
VSILRGIKEKYELHHGVRITDSALVAAAQLSHRYITDRFLPDKAIDLMDEAASRLRMEIDSKPEELDALDRQLLQLQIEAEALKKEDDAASKDRLARLEREMAELGEQSAAMTAKWQAERDKLESARTIKERLDAARAELDRAKREGNLAEAGRLAYWGDPADGARAFRGRGAGRPPRRGGRAARADRRGGRALDRHPDVADARR